MSQSLFDALSALSHDSCQFEPGAVLFAQGDHVRNMHLIQSGNVHLVRHQVGGFALTLHRAGAGAVIAEASLFSGVYHCDAVAMVKTQTLSIAKPLIHAAMARDSGLAQSWAAFLAHEVQATRLRAEILALRTVAERLAAWLAMHNGAMPARGDWKSVAGEIGVSAEALYRELAKRRKARLRPGATL